MDVLASLCVVTAPHDTKNGQQMINDHHHQGFNSMRMYKCPVIISQNIIF